jgi:hypothetical protein
MTSAKTLARRRAPIAHSSAKTSEPKMKAKSEATAMRDALPFFRKGRGKVETSWWNVTPSGDYATDLETGMSYARAFLPLLMFNAGASDLGCIVSHMALAGRDRSRTPEDWRGIDSIALGFMMGIGGSLQSAVGCIGIAAAAIEKPKGELGTKFVELVKSGNALAPLRRNTLFHDPRANIFSAGGGR